MFWLTCQNGLQFQNGVLISNVARALILGKCIQPGLSLEQVQWMQLLSQLFPIIEISYEVPIMMFTFQLSTYTHGLPASPYLRLLNKYYTKVGTLIGDEILQKSAVTPLIKQKYFFCLGLPIEILYTTYQVFYLSTKYPPFSFFKANISTDFISQSNAIKGFL